MKAKQLFLADLANLDDAGVRKIIRESYEAPEAIVNRFDIMIAHQDSGGYEGTAWFLLRDRQTRALFEVHASHCSCMGFEDQFNPESTTLAYLRSDKFSPGYGAAYFKEEIQEFINTLAPRVRKA